jgi:hypothetical protein
VNCGPRSNFLYIAISFTFTRTLYFYLHTITFYHSIRSILCLQQTGEIDNLIVSWGKVLGCVVCRFHIAARWRSSYVNYAPAFSGAIVRSVAKLASITFWSLSFSYWFDKLWFHNWGKFADVLLIPSSWGSQLGAYHSLIRGALPWSSGAHRAWGAGELDFAPEPGCVAVRLHSLFSDPHTRNQGHHRPLPSESRWPLPLGRVYFSGIFTPKRYGDLVFTQYSQIPSNTLPQKYSTMMESF